MSFIIDLGKDTDKVLMTRIQDRNIDLELKWNKGLEYCYDTKTYKDYCVVKQIQINMDHEGYKDVPVI
jgi:hypothetical protein